LSETGFCKAVLLSPSASAVVSAARGAAWLEVSGVAARFALTGEWWALFGAIQRVAVADGSEATLSLQSKGEARFLIQIDSERLPPFLDAMLAAIRFSEGKT